MPIGNTDLLDIGGCLITLELSWGFTMEGLKYLTLLEVSTGG